MPIFRMARSWGRRWMPSLRFYRVPLLLSLLFVALACCYFRHSLQHFSAVEEPDAQPRSIVDMIKEIYTPLIPRPDAPVIRLATGEEYTLNSTKRLHWRAPLGEKLCIVDIDNRPFNQPHQLLHPAPLSWYKFHSYGFGVLNHYIYARIHNYTYRFIRTGYADRSGTWSKIRGILQVLQGGDPSCDVLVIVDADAVFSNLQLPIEWLLNRWAVGPQAALALAQDPAANRHNDSNHDSRGAVNLNTGFMVVRNTRAAVELVAAIEACPGDEAGCGRFRWGWPHEQGALSEFVRYGAGVRGRVVEVGCAEANGWPSEEGGVENDGCEGVFVQHNWYRKDELRRVVADALAAGMVPRVHEQFWSEREEVVVDYGGALGSRPLSQP